jgi:hypothetical protein
MEKKAQLSFIPYALLKRNAASDADIAGQALDA